MAICVSCKQKTNSTVNIKEMNGCMCGKCLDNYYHYKKLEIDKKIGKLQDQIIEIEKQKKSFDRLINRAKMEDCNHENLKSTGFCRTDTYTKKLFKEFECLDCGNKVLKEKISIQQLKEKVVK